MNNLSWSSQEVISLIMNQMNSGFIVAEYPTGKILQYNKASEDILGHSVIQATDVSEYSSYGGFKPNGEKLKPIEYPTARALMNGEVVTNEEMLYLTPSKTIKVLSINASPINDEAGNRLGAVCVFHDITQNKSSLGQVKLLLEESPFAVALFDSQGQYLHLNSKLSKFNGLPIEEHIGKKPGQLFGDAGAKVEEIIAEVLKTNRPYSNCIIETATPAHPHEVRTYCLQFYPVRLDGNSLGVGFFAEDITVKEAERKFKDREHIKTLSEKEQITQFINILSHDIRTPLSAIRFNAQMIYRNLNNEQRLTSIAQKITDLTTKTERLITDVLDVNTLKRGEAIEAPLELVDLNNCIRSSIENFESIHGNIFNLELTEIKPGMWNSLSIERILENLISNAIKYSVKGSRITISTSEMFNQAVFSVNNIGTVLSPEDMDQIFIPFKKLHTTISEAKSYGLGLAIVKGLVETLQGEILVTSTHQSGTTFTIKLPYSRT